MSLSDVPNFLCGMFSSTLNLSNPNKLSLKPKNIKKHFGGTEIPIPRIPQR